VDKLKSGALAASEGLRALKLNGALLADETGFGKTEQALLVTLITSITTNSGKPTLLVVPATLIYQ
jgi:SNF2 family DNA or RNA helicase